VKPSLVSLVACFVVVQCALAARSIAVAEETGGAAPPDEGLPGVSVPVPAAVPVPVWELVAAEGELDAVPGVLETRWQLARPPGGEFDRIQLHRYRGEGERRAALLYLPGTNMNGSVSVEDERHDIWLFLARRGVEVFALDYRTHFVPNEALEDSAFMRYWGLDAFTADARAAAALARRESGREKLFLAGFSRGVSLAYATAATEPEGSITGLIVLDGSFKDARPDAPFDFDAALGKLSESKRWASDVSGRLGWEKRHALMSAAAADPSGPPLDPGFESVGEQVSTILYEAWGAGALANPVEGVSRVEVLARLLDGYDRYYPTIQNVEGRSLASQDDDPRTDVDDRWGELEIPIIYFGAATFGAPWVLNGVYSAARSGSEDVTLHLLEGYGHLDVLVGEGVRAEVFEPTLEWMMARRE